MLIHSGYIILVSCQSRRLEDVGTLKSLKFLVGPLGSTYTNRMKRKHTAVRIHLPCPGWGSLLIHVGSQDDVGMLCMNCGEAALQKSEHLRADCWLPSLFPRNMGLLRMSGRNCQNLSTKGRQQAASQDITTSAFCLAQTGAFSWPESA